LYAVGTSWWRALKLSNEWRFEPESGIRYTVLPPFSGSIFKLSLVRDFLETAPLTVNRIPHDAVRPEKIPGLS
jgi:hypothetical protein